MWAAVPTIPDVFTVPWTIWQVLEAFAHRDGLAEMSVVPDAVVVTGGTSSAPLSAVMPLVFLGWLAHPATRSAAAPRPNQRDRLRTGCSDVIVCPPASLVW
jgi:hypothetical protein